MKNMITAGVSTYSMFSAMPVDETAQAEAVGERIGAAGMRARPAHLGDGVGEDRDT